MQIGMTPNAVQEVREMKQQIAEILTRTRRGLEGGVIMRQHLAWVGSTAITAAVYSTTPDTVGSGDVTLYRANSDDELVTIKDTQGDDITVTVCNASIIPSGEDLYVWVRQDSTGKWWLDNGNAGTPICSFTLNAAMATTDASKGADIETCNLKSLVGDTITVYNHAASSDYIFEGDSGDYGTAYYDQNNEKWYIIQMECP